MCWGDGAYLFGKAVYLKEEQLWFQAAAASWQNSINYKKGAGNKPCKYSWSQNF